MAEVLGLAWAPGDLGDALGALAAALDVRGRSAPRPPSAALVEPAALARWIDDAAAWLGVETEAVYATGADLRALVAQDGPALLKLGPADAPRFLVVLGARRGWMRVRTPDLRQARVRVEDVADAILVGADASILGDVDRTLDAAGLVGARRARARAALVRERVAGLPLAAGWVLRLPPSAPFDAQLRGIDAPFRMLGLALGHAASWALGLGAWWMIGRGALEGRLDPGWLIAWALLLLTQVPVHAALLRAEGRLALDVGGLLKRRLLLGALRLRAEEVRQHGLGQLLGRVIESEAVESAATGGALFALFAVLELVLAAVVLGAGVGGALHVALLAAWVAGTIALGAVYYRRRRAWSTVRLDLTGHLLEHLVGHRTRLAQQDPARRHDADDADLLRYVRASSRLDAAAAVLGALAPAGWVVVALLGLAPAVVAGHADPSALAVSVGGVLLVHGSLRQLVGGVAAVAGAGIAWRQVRALFDAATRSVPTPPPGAFLAGSGGDAPLLAAHGVHFRHEGRSDAVLASVDLAVRAGERLLLEGPSGGGKSTLAALLAGLRTPTSGLILLGGLDRRTLGADGWRRRVASAPQLHENHVFAGSFAFNLLMGRGWPASHASLAEAEALCVELGLEPLLRRMPAGMLQQVGETGWQLSHGERSRLYIARALLQGADLVLLDESFASLDPENLRSALRCVRARARALLVVAHP